MITIISDDSRQQVGRRIKSALELSGVKFEYFSADEMNIRPCTACGSCSGQTAGRCVQQDDMAQIYRALARGSTWMLISPVVFGGYSRNAKQVQDRTSALGDPHYYVANGELVKGSGHIGSRFFALGVKEACPAAEKETFISLHRENVRIMNCGGDAFVLGENPGDREIKNIVEALRHG